jgi:hypothetical protein
MGNQLTISFDRAVVIRRHSKDDFGRFNAQRSSSIKHISASGQRKTSLQLWHERLGHLSVDSIIKLPDLVDGIAMIRTSNHRNLPWLPTARAISPSNVDLITTNLSNWSIATYAINACRRPTGKVLRDYHRLLDCSCLLLVTKGDASSASGIFKPRSNANTT